MNFYTYSGSSWRQIKNAWTYVNGTWQQVKKGWTYVNGIWKQFYSSANAPVKSVSPSLSGNTQVLSSVSAVAGTYTNYSYIVSTRVVHATSSGDLVEGGSYSVETSPYLIPQSIRGTYIAARDIVYGLDGSLYYYFSTPVQITVGTVSDTFNRTNAANLGTSSGGLVWSTQQAAWAITSNQASSSNSITNSSPYTDYPISTIDVRRADGTSSANVTGGTALTFWYTAAGSWWAAGPYYTNSTAVITSTVNVPRQCHQITTTNTAQCTCGNIVLVGSSTVCTTTSTTYVTSNPGNCTCGYSYWDVIYSCSSGTLSGSSCITSFTYSSSSSVCNQSCVGDPDPTCTHSYNSTTGQCTNTYSAPATATTRYKCDAGYNTTTNTYDCNYEDQAAYSYTVNTSHYYGYSNIKILSTVSNVISTVATQQLASTDSTSGYTYTNINSISVNTSGNTITVKGYSGSKSLPTDALTGQIGSDLVYLATSPTKVSGSGSSEVGLTKVTTDYNYGTTIDNFYNTA